MLPFLNEKQKTPSTAISLFPISETLLSTLQNNLTHTYIPYVTHNGFLHITAEVFQYKRRVWC